MASPAPVLLLLAYLAFISLGLPDTVLGVAWPSLRDGFNLAHSDMAFVLAAGISGYILSGLVAGALMTWLGVGGLLTVSGGLVAVALAAYAMAPSFYVFVPVAGLMGLGSGAIDAGLNGYAARHFSVRHLNWLHACWGLGASLGPLIMTAAIAQGFGYRWGYAGLAVVLAAMASAFLMTRRRWSEPARPREATTSAAPRFNAAIRSGRVWLLMATFFLYTGLESSLGQWCFTLLREGRGLSVKAAGAWTAAYWASLTLGRVALGFVVDRWGPDRLLRIASLALLSGATAFAMSEGVAGRAGLLVMGLSLAPVFPTLMARTPARVGTSIAAHAVGFQVSAATLGSALLPGAVGVLVARIGHGAISGAALGFGLAYFFAHEVLLRATRSSP